ncbi:cytochrome P450 [Agromyces sp. NPDC049794]|uniref:cytochrome P450 n=1 Tax=unclassified Agromyces TaxID=2639701 RepID=UPI0033F72259
MAGSQTGSYEIDWEPRSAEAQADQIAAYDAMRARCPVAYSRYGNWAVFGHADNVAILDDPETYSNAVSHHRSVPNGYDGAEHAAYRAIVDRYYTSERMAAFESECRRIARELVRDVPLGEDVEIMSALAEPFANNVQCAFMGWPEGLRMPLREWTRKNHDATLAADREAMSAVALEFDSFITEQLDLRRDAPAELDATAALLHEEIDGRRLTDDEIVSIIRNWTVGELATIAAAVGIMAHFLAEHPEVQRLLRDDPGRRVAASDEILRIQAPLIGNRRRTTKPVSIGGRTIPAGERVIVLWASANRDERVFGDPDEFRLDRDPADNLVYGRGVHDCPGAPLARLELRVLFEEIFAATRSIEPGHVSTPVNARYPTGGYERVHLRME